MQLVEGACTPLRIWAKAGLSSLQILSEQSREFNGLEEEFRALPCFSLVIPRLRVPTLRRTRQLWATGGLCKQLSFLTALTGIPHVSPGSSSSLRASKCNKPRHTGKHRGYLSQRGKIRWHLGVGDPLDPLGELFFFSGAIPLCKLAC